MIFHFTTKLLPAFFFYAEVLRPKRQCPILKFSYNRILMAEKLAVILFLYTFAPFSGMRGFSEAPHFIL